MARTGFKAQMYVEGQLCTLTQDFSFAVSRTDIQSKNRGLIWTKYLKGMKDVPIDFDLTTDENDPQYQALSASFDSDADDDYIEIELTDKPKTSTGWSGFKADWVVTKFEKSEPLDDEAKTSVSIRIAAGSPNEPSVTGE